MSDRTDSADDLSRRKLEHEVIKLTEEVAKLREDRRWYNRHLAVLGAVCGVAATFAVGFAQFSTTRERNLGDVRWAKREDHRRDVETSLKLVQFAAEKGADFLSGDVDRQSRFVRLVDTLLPPQEAQRVLSALRGVTTQAPVLEQLAQLGAAYDRSAATPPRPDAASPAGPGAAPAEAALRVFAHIAEEDDRAAARRVALGLGANFPLAGVEFVPAWGAVPRSAGDVRFYRREQAARAAELAQRLRAAVKDSLGLDVAFNTRDISATYPNLPGDRIEVWFPKLPNAAGAPR